MEGCCHCPRPGLPRFGTHAPDRIASPDASRSIHDVLQQSVVAGDVRGAVLRLRLGADPGGSPVAEAFAFHPHRRCRARWQLDHYFFYKNPAPTDFYTLSYTTLFR